MVKHSDRQTATIVDERKATFAERYPGATSIIRGVGAALGVTGLVLGVSVGLLEGFSSDRDDTELDGQIARGIEEDGFEGAEITWSVRDGDGGRAMAALDLGACTLHRVHLDFEEGAGDTLTGLDYEFSNDIGTVVFVFNDMQSLKADILGDQPCRTLAANGGITQTELG